MIIFFTVQNHHIESEAHILMWQCISQGDLTVCSSIPGLIYAQIFLLRKFHDN